MQKGAQCHTDWCRDSQQAEQSRWWGKSLVSVMQLWGQEEAWEEGGHLLWAALSLHAVTAGVTAGEVGRGGGVPCV